MSGKRSPTNDVNEDERPAKAAKFNEGNTSGVQRTTGEDVSDDNFISHSEAEKEKIPGIDLNKLSDEPVKVNTNDEKDVEKKPSDDVDDESGDEIDNDEDESDEEEKGEDDTKDEEETAVVDEIDFTREKFLLLQYIK